MQITLLKVNFITIKTSLINENNNSQFHAMSMSEERVRTEITVVPAYRPNIIIEIGVAKIHESASEIAV
ncbi:hypothetical protein [Clostridium beijerinckii]|uniref:hypothetical protein n=1 Tax=Clostridium beijerinckii TaxID=1520 RepID=UPI001F4BDAD5|nr:hypothetical protein [Clostridium beijerinckii]NRT72257.1 hypothetical protein [Clostridium beijerinckii]